MSFLHPWALALLVLPAAWIAWQWRRAGRRGGLVLKGLSVALVLAALAEPRLAVWETRMAVTVLVDTSASVSRADLAAASRLADQIEAARGRNFVRILPFARSTRLPYPEEHERGWHFEHTRGAAGRATNLEAALTDALAAAPADRIPRVALISDGRENHGGVLRAIWQARHLAIPVDVYPLAGRAKPALRFDSVRDPGAVYAGEEFPIELTLRAPARDTGRLTIRVADRRLGGGPVRLSPGVNHLRVAVKLDTEGSFDLSGVLRTTHLGSLQFAHVITVHKPRVLLLSRDPRGADNHWLQALAASGFAVVPQQTLPGGRLAGYQVVVLNNWNLKRIPIPVQVRLARFVEEGGGLLVIGGERNIFGQQPPPRPGPLARVLPARLAPPRAPESTCVVLIIDKSSSMEGRKIELARRSAVGVVENLRPEDRVGVLIFDSTFRWAVPIRRANDKPFIERLIAGIVADGGTQIAPALAEAYRTIVPVQAAYKHIVLLTDGISEEGNSIALAQQAARRRVTISTVGLGQDVNRSYLKKIALYAHGKAYFLSDPSGLVRILLRDVMEHTGETMVERPVRAVPVRPAEILRGLSIRQAPPLLGYVRFVAKPSAETILRFPSKDPLLVRWQYGLGRAAVFASDAKSRWAAKWIRWNGFDEFWTRVVRDLLPRSAEGQARIRYDRADDELVMEYRLGPDLAARQEDLQLYLFGPGNFSRPLPLRAAAPGVYRAVVPIGSRKGLFRVRSLRASRWFPETGIYLQEKELADFGSDQRLLEQIARLTGGKVAPQPRGIFDRGRRLIASTLSLWPGLLLLGLLLNLAELILRKWRRRTAAR